MKLNNKEIEKIKIRICSLCGKTKFCPLRGGGTCNTLANNTWFFTNLFHKASLQFKVTGEEIENIIFEQLFQKKPLYPKIGTAETASGILAKAVFKFIQEKENE